MSDSALYTLHLPFAPTPENAPRLAQSAIALFSPLGYDFTSDLPGTIRRVLGDLALEGFTREECSSMLFQLGCLLGEAFVRDGGRWRATNQTALANFTTFPLVVEIGGHVKNPLAIVFRCFDDPSSELEVQRPLAVDNLTKTTLSAGGMYTFAGSSTR